MSEKNKYKIYSDIKIVFDKQLISEESYNLALNTPEYKYGELLISYFQNLENDDEKEYYINTMKENILNENLTFLCFYVSYNLGITNDILSSIVGDLMFGGKSTTYSLIVLFEKNINYFDSKQLSDILEIVDSFSPHEFDENWGEWIERKNNLRKQIINFRFENFEKQIKGINIEINRDKQTVQEYLRDFGFHEKYNITLNQLDKYIKSEQGEGEVVPGGVIGILREFFNNFYNDLALKIAELHDLDEVPKNKNSTTPIGHSRNYITKEFQLSSEEHRFLDTYKDICNNSGSHALLSEKKYLRLARNIGIEILLFILEKFKDQTMSSNEAIE